MYCRGCDYDLRGLSIARCPECGRGFDTADPASYYTFPWRSRARRRTTRTYLALLGIHLALWLFICLVNSSPTAYGRLRSGVVGGIVAANGPLLALPSWKWSSPSVEYVGRFFLVSLCFCALIKITQFGTLPALVHAVFAIVWLLIGSIMLGAAI